MYRCNDNLKGCLSVSANRIDKRINVNASILNEELKVIVKPIGRRIIVTCSLICSVSKTPYLNVNPDYVWLTPDILSSGEFDIISNVKWIIE